MKTMRLIHLLLLPVLGLTACATPDNTAMPEFERLKQLTMPAPQAPRVPYTAEYHGRTLSDPYHWLKDQSYPEVNDQPVLDYLKAENAYYQAFMTPHQGLADKIFEEFRGRTDEEESSVPYIDNGYEYQWFFRPGEEYRTRTRKNLSTGAEAIFLDETALAKGHEYFVLGGWEISSDNRYLAYSFDTAGDERYQVRIKDLQTGVYLADTLDGVEGGITFSADGKSLIYAFLEEDKWLAKNIKVHNIGEPQSADLTLYYEEDDGFFIDFGKTSSKEFLLIVSSQGEVQETYVVPSDLSTKPELMVSRDAGFSHSVDHAHGEFYILANDTHKNFRLAKVSDQAPAQENWQTVQAGSDDVYLLSLQTFDSFLAVKSRDLGLEKIHVHRYTGEHEEISFPETVFAASIGINPEFDQTHLRVDYESMITPETVFDYDLTTQELTTRKVQKIPSGYDKAMYDTERLMITARDGAQVPVTLVFKKGLKKDGSHPLWLYAYGAYASTVKPNFSTGRLSALDRGFVYAVAHVRGGAMMGYNWYLDGKFEHRENTFNDFVDVAKGLVAAGYSSAGNISASGRSAGGELMGAIAIQSPELWRSINLGVPFVDVLNTMLDATLPLTPPEWQEWGNPIKSASDYDLIASYSPYDNIVAREYPPMFVSGGLNDPRVTYWEPAKWTARMRELKTDNNLLVMRINMGAGHFSNSGRYGRLKDYAEEYAFMFLAHGINE
jgi:oligopeptidase B